jgi:Family of unknown function (DUF6463)
METVVMKAQSSNGTRVWIGYWLLAVAVLHTIYAGVFFGKTFLDIAGRGLIDTVGRDPQIGAPVWFALCGFAFALFGMAVTNIERRGQHSSLRPLGLGMFLLSVLGLILMPASGFWLCLPPAIAMMLKPK